MTPTNATPNSSLSPAQLEANRANSQHSTGPVTDAGKDKIRFNAVKHGVCSKAILLPSEDKAAFEALGECLAKIWVPSGELELLKFGELHECYWRIERIRKAESNLLALGTREHYAQFADVADLELRRGMAEAAAWRANAKQFNMFRRHENALLREKEELERILTRLLQLRTQQSQQKAQADSRANSMPRTDAVAQRPANPNGFVSHTAPAQPANSVRVSSEKHPDVASRS